MDYHASCGSFGHQLGTNEHLGDRTGEADSAQSEQAVLAVLLGGSTVSSSVCRRIWNASERSGAGTVATQMVDISVLRSSNPGWPRFSLGCRQPETRRLH